MLDEKVKESVGFLKIIFPPYWLLLIFYSDIIGLFINYSLVDLRLMIINLIWLPLFTIPFILSRKRTFLLLAIIFYFVNGLTNLLHWILIQSPISASSLFVLFSTNLEESIDFIELKHRSIFFLLILPYFAILIIAIHQYKNLLSSDIKINKKYIIAVLLISFIFLLENAINNRFIRKGTPVLLKTIVSYYIESKELKKNQIEFNKQSKIRIISKDTLHQQVYVVIIGESANRNHMSIYGYVKNTNPLLKSRDDIFVFDNVVSPYSNTIESVLSSLTSSNLDNKLNFAESINVFQVFKLAGFKTFWISNQMPFGAWDNLITSLAKNADVVNFVNVSSNSSFESTYNISYDEKIFPYFIKHLNDPTKNKIIFIHLMGSHSAYKKRYPPKFNVFQNNLNDKEKTIYEYDNSILYNDYVVNNLIQILKNHTEKNNIVSALLYYSDHGENVFDEFNYAGHDFADKISRHNIEIPLILWLSNSYQQVYVDKTNIIKNNLHKPYMTDDLFHSILDLSNIDADVLEKQRSLFNKNFNEHRKRILCNGELYNTSP